MAKHGFCFLLVTIGVLVHFLYLISSNTSKRSVKNILKLKKWREIDGNVSRNSEERRGREENPSKINSYFYNTFPPPHKLFQITVGPSLPHTTHIIQCLPNGNLFLSLPFGGPPTKLCL
jgi:hypothetical protein